MDKRQLAFWVVFFLMIAGAFFIGKHVFAEGEDISGDHSMPEVCRVGQSETDTGPRDLIAQHAEALANYQRLEQLIQTTPNDDPQKGEISRQLEEARALESRLKTQIETTMGAGGPEGGPSDACKAAVVAKEKVNIQNVYGKIQSNFLPMMENVSAITVEVESNLPTLKSSGQITDAQAAQIETDLVVIKAELATTKSAFEKVKNLFGSFLAQADSNPNAAFELIKNGPGFGGANPKTSADKLAAAFKDLKTIMGNVKE